MFLYSRFCWRMKKFSMMDMHFSTIPSRLVRAYRFFKEDMTYTLRITINQRTTNNVTIWRNYCTRPSENIESKHKKRLGIELVLFNCTGEMEMDNFSYGIRTRTPKIQKYFTIVVLSITLSIKVGNNMKLSLY